MNRRKHRPEPGTSALIPYRQGFARGWLGLSSDHDYQPGSAFADAFLTGYRVGQRESLRYVPNFGAQSMRGRRP